MEALPSPDMVPSTQLQGGRYGSTPAHTAPGSDSAADSGPPYPSTSASPTWIDATPGDEAGEQAPGAGLFTVQAQPVPWGQS
jgi:hypothetical protein